ncbi:MAG: phosphatase PAP2 family protein [Ginsengibacter sp.]
MTLKSVYKQNQTFFLGYFFLLIIAIILLVIDTKKAAFLLLNPYHSDFLNYFFIGVTFIGDGFFSIIICIVALLFKKRFLSFMIFVSFATSGIFAQVLKAFIREGRPAMFLKNSNYPYFIDHVTLHNFHSFPSGHTTSAFALVAILAFALKNKKYAIPLVALGALVGYSRIYLGQHFLLDVTVGSFVGVIFSFFCWIVFQKYFNKIEPVLPNGEKPIVLKDEMKT